MKQRFAGYTFLTMSLCEEEVCGKESLLKFAREMTETIHQNYRAGNNKIETALPSHITGELMVEEARVGTLQRLECPPLLRSPVPSCYLSAGVTEEGEGIPKKNLRITSLRQCTPWNSFSLAVKAGWEKPPLPAQRRYHCQRSTLESASCFFLPTRRTHSLTAWIW